MKKLWKKFLPLLSFMIPSLIGGGLVGIYPGYKVYEYVWKDAAFCTSCHVHDYATVGWENSSHQRLTTCHDCHHQPLHEYVREMVVLLTKNPKFPKDLDHIPYIPDDLCQACHISNHQDLSTVTGPLDKEDIDKLHKVDKTKMHQLHFQHKTKLKLLGEFKIKKIDRMGDVAIIPSNEEGKERPITCSDCHGGPSNRAHNFSATDSACVRCHQDEHKKKIGKEFGCRNCHFQDFMIPTSKNPTK